MFDHTTETRPDPVALTKEWFRATTIRLIHRPELLLSIANQLIKDQRIELTSGKNGWSRHADLTNQALLPARLALDFLGGACAGGFKGDVAQHPAIVTEIYELNNQLQLLVMNAVDRRPEQDTIYEWERLLAPLSALAEVVNQARGIFRRLKPALSVPSDATSHQTLTTMAANIYTRMSAIVEAQARLARSEALPQQATAKDKPASKLAP